ncbi:MAG: hypothetical protein NWS33_07400 [Burkholderiaceae bacterium]|jgi:hypothetical protein|nr:hypothetical protein [Burkholderiaceae bacterium]MDP4863672.1 hypothetical protein [Burkholderiaceae bacterium]
MTGWHSRGMATISLLLLMGVTSAMLAALWYAQAQNRTQVDATQIALDRNLARQVVWQRVYNALTLASDVQPPVFEAPAGHTDDWWIAGTLDSGTAVAVMSQGTLLVGLPPNLPANHPAHTARYWREAFTTDDSLVVWRVTLWFAGDVRRPARWQQAWWKAPASEP